MGQITREFAQMYLELTDPDRPDHGRHAPLTVWEQHQLFHAWLERDALRADAEGMVLVPRMPTKPMLEAAVAYTAGGVGRNVASEIWNTMLMASKKEFRKSSEKPQNSETVGGFKFQIQKANYDQS